MVTTTMSPCVASQSRVVDVAAAVGERAAVDPHHHRAPLIRRRWRPHVEGQAVLVALPPSSRSRPGSWTHRGPGGWRRARRSRPVAGSGRLPPQRPDRRCGVRDSGEHPMIDPRRRRARDPRRFAPPPGSVGSAPVRLAPAPRLHAAASTTTSASDQHAVDQDGEAMLARTAFEPSWRSGSEPMRLPITWPPSPTLDLTPVKFGPAPADRSLDEHADDGRRRQGTGRSDGLCRRRPAAHGTHPSAGEQSGGLGRQSAVPAVLGDHQARRHHGHRAGQQPVPLRAAPAAGHRRRRRHAQGSARGGHRDCAP